MWKFWSRFLFFILAIPLVPFAVFGELPGTSWLEHANSRYIFFMGFLLLASDIFLPVPSSLLAVVIGAKLGFWMGTLAIALGLNIGSAIGFYSGWYLGHPLAFRRASEKQRKTIDDLQNRFGYVTLALLRAVPVLAEVSVLGAGAARFKSGPVFLTLLVANFSLALLYAGLGSTGQTHSSPTLLLVGGIGVPACGIVLVHLARGLSQGLVRS